MATTTINISLSKQLLDEADRVAEKEYRNRSELIREALRSYILTRQNLDSLYGYSALQARKKRVTVKSLDRVIADYRGR
jgi:metal-responsive CopG/Arc/MetJ family transcriptional regulator